MPAELLIKAQASPDLPKGSILAVMPHNWQWGSAEGPPSFCTVTVVDRTSTQIKDYMKSWMRTVSLNILSTSAGEALVELSNTDIRGADDSGSFTQAEVQPFIDRWNGQFVEVFEGKVRFSLSVFGIISSPHFWQKPVAGVIFTVLGTGDGRATIRVDYSALSVTPNAVASLVTSRHGEILSHVGSVIEFDIAVSKLLRPVYVSLRELEKLIAKRRFRFTDTAVDSCLANGGHMNVTAQQAQNNLVDLAS